MPISPKQLVDVMRKKNPLEYGDLSDTELYQTLQQKYPTRNLPSWNPVRPKDTEDLLSVDANPGVFEWLATTNFMTDSMLDKGFGGISADFFKSTYNQSLPGLIWQAKYGKKRYELDDKHYEPSVLAAAGQFAVGLLSPIELATFAASGGTAKLATSAVSKFVMKGLSSGAAKKGAESVFLHNIITGATQTGFGLGTYGAAHGAAQSAASQKQEYGEINYQQVAKDAGAAFGESFAIGALTGGIVKGSMGTIHGYAARRLKSDPNFSNKVQKLLTGEVPQIGAEGSMIGALPTVFGMEGSASFGSDEFYHEIFKNVLIVGGLRGANRLWNGDKQVDMMQVLDTELKLEGSSLAAESKALGKVLAEVKDIPSQEALRIVAQKEMILSNLPKDIKQTKADAKRFKEILEKTDDPQYMKKLQEGHPDLQADRLFIMKHGNKLQLANRHVLSEILKDDTKLKKHWKDQNKGKEPTDAQLEIFRKAVENQVGHIDNWFGHINEVITGMPHKNRPSSSTDVKAPTIGGETIEAWSTKSKKSIVERYNAELERKILKYYKGKSDKQKQEVRDIFQIKDTKLTRDNLVGKLFRLEENIAEIAGPVEGPTRTPATKQTATVNELKKNTVDAKELERRINDPSYDSIYMADQATKKQAVQLTKEIKERKPSVNLNQKQKKVYNENKAIIHDMLQNKFLGAEAKGGGSGVEVSRKTIADKVKILNEINDYASIRSKSIFELTESEIRGFMAGKGANESAVMNSLIENHKGRFVSEAVRNLSPKVVKGMVKVKISERKGFKVDYLTKDGIDVTMGKTGFGKEVPVTKGLLGRLLSLVGYNKHKGISFRHERKKGEYDPKLKKNIPDYHEFLFLEINGKPITTETLKRILQKLQGTEAWRKTGNRMFTGKAFRKSFTTFIETKYPHLKKVADKYILGHETGKMDVAYFKTVAERYKELLTRLDEFAGIIEGKGKVKWNKKHRQTDKSLVTANELRELVKGIKELQDTNGVVKIGNSKINAETLEVLINYMAQGGGRITETLPTNNYLNDIGFNKAFKKWSKTDKKTTKEPPETGGTGGGGAAPVADISKMSQSGANTMVKNSFQSLYETLEIKSNSSKARDVRKLIYEWSGIGKDFKLGKNAMVEDLNAVYGTLNRLIPSQIKSALNQKGKMKLITSIEKNRKLVNITEADSKRILQNLGAQDGSMFHPKTTTLQLQTYQAIIQQMKPVKHSKIAWLDDAITDGISRQGAKTKIMNWLATKKMTLPVTKVFESIGLKKLSRALYSHIAAEQNHAGKIWDFEASAKKHIGRVKFNKYKEYLYLTDKARYQDLVKNKDIKPKEKAFIEKAMHLDTWKPKNNAEGKVIQELIKFNKYYKDSMKTILKKVLNEAQYEAFKKSGNIKWVSKDNIYIHRGLTKEFKKYYDPEGRNYQKLVEHYESKIAKEMAVEKYNTTNPTLEQIAEMRLEANAKAVGELGVLFEFNPGKFSSSFVKGRGPKLPEYMNIEGKRIKVYETAYDLTIQSYANGMSKFLANLEFFPEYLSMQGLKIPGQTKRIKSLEVALNKDVADWVDKKVKEHLGIDRNPTDIPVAATRISNWASMLAKFQLSFPTSGLKNLLVGNTQTVAAFKMRHFFMGIVDSMSSDNRRLVKNMNAYELGMKHFDEIKFNKFLGDSVFKLGFMRPTEKINRIISVLAGLRMAKETVRTLKKAPVGSKLSKKAEYRLYEFYKLDKNEIDIARKYGINPEAIDVTSKTFKNVREGSRIKRQVEIIEQKIGTMSHIGTQGASIDVLMPSWASGQIAKSMVLYKKMAYAAWENTKTNMKVAYKTGSPMHLAWFSLATYMSGESMIWVYETLLGQQMKTKHGSAYEKFMTTLWKGEALGILSELFNPNKQGLETLKQSFNPAVASHMEVVIEGLSNFANQKKFWFEGKTGTGIGPLKIGQMTDHVLRKTVGFYNGVQKIRELGKGNEYYSAVQEFKKTHKEFSRKMNENKEYKPNQHLFAEFEKSKYMAAFQDMFHLGTEKQMAKWYILSLFSKANDYLHEGRAPGVVEGQIIPIRTEAEAFKQAYGDMKRSLTNLNPVREIVDPVTGKIDISGRRQYAYFKYLAGKEYLAMSRTDKGQQLLRKSGGEKKLWQLAFKKSDAVQRLLKAEKTYKSRLKLLKEVMPKYLDEFNVKRMLEYYGLKYIT